LPDNKVEITFKDERRVLVHNRSDLAERMQPEIADAPAPRDVKRKKKRKGPQSELAARLLQERARASTERKDFAETALAKRLAAERAAAQKKRIAQGLEPESNAEQRKLERADASASPRKRSAKRKRSNASRPARRKPGSASWSSRRS
jgi:hypothetical protein